MLIGRNRWLGRSMRVADWCTRTASIGIGALKQANLDVWTWLSPALRTLLKHAANGWPVPALLVLAPSVAWLRRKTDKSKLEAVHHLLNTFRDEVFKSSDFEHEQHRRVTLFRYRTFCIHRRPWFHGWLVPVERSGTLTRKTSAIFKAPDDGEHGEGVAGRAWSKKSIVYVGNLPDLRDHPSDEDFDEYAEKSFMGTESLRSKPPQARSLCGLHLEVSGAPWGVLVIDSVHPNLSQRKVEQAFPLLANALSSLLKGL